MAPASQAKLSVLSFSSACEEQRCCIVCSKSDVVTARKCPQVPRRPHVMYVNRRRASQSWYIGEVDVKRRGSVVGVHDKYVSSAARVARVELWRFRRGRGCGRCKWHGGFAYGLVLVESDEFLVLDDLQLLAGEPCELCTHESDRWNSARVQN
jgi:hypothetical protein